MTFVNYYKVLGIKDHATAAEIKKAYRSLAFRYHPDQNKGGQNSDARFREIKEAYEILTDTVKKGHFDAELRSRQAYSQVYGFGKFVPESPLANPAAQPSLNIPKPETAKKYGVWKAVVLILITIGLMYLIMMPPRWLANIFGNK